MEDLGGWPAQEAGKGQTSGQYTGRAARPAAPLLLFVHLCCVAATCLPHLPAWPETPQAGKPWAINASGNSVLHLICSMEKADDTPVSCAALISFL
jgi:hypothetical protein